MAKMKKFDFPVLTNKMRLLSWPHVQKRKAKARTMDMNKTRAQQLLRWATVWRQ